MGVLEIKDLCVGFGKHRIVENFSLTVAHGELFSLLGPSGSGKTTLLKAIAGLLFPGSGTVWIDGRDVTRAPAQKRSAVMVFQKPLLFPFLNVAENIGFGLKMTGVSPREAGERIERIMGLTRLEGLAERRVQSLSGGQQQRVSLARALVLEPSVLLLDEPLSSLDANLRQQMRGLVREIQAKTGVTTLFVTHDQAEALSLSHRMGLLLKGGLRQVGTPEDLFHRPVDPEVARFFGGENFLEGAIEKHRFRCALGNFPVREVDGDGSPRMAVIRPEAIRISARPIHPVEAKVERTRFEGMASRVWVRANGLGLVVLCPEHDYKAGQPVWLDLPAEKIRVFPGNHGRSDTGK